MRFLLLFFFAYNFADGKIGYGSSTSVVTAKIQEGFFMGFELGLKSITGKEYLKSNLLVNQLSTPAPLGAHDSVSSLHKMGASMLFGFPGSYDALIAAKYSSKHKILSFFPGCNHSGLAQMGSTVLSTGHSMEKEVTFIKKVINKKFFRKKVLVIINPYAAPSMDQERYFLSDNSSAGLLSVIRINSELKLEERELLKLKAKQYDLLVFTSYPEAMVKLTEQLSSNSIDLPTIAGSAWGAVDSDVMRRYISNKKGSFYILTSWLKTDPVSNNFVKLFQNEFGRDPTPDNAYGYDLGVIAGTLAKRTRGALSAESVYKTYASDRCFTGLSVGRLCFPVSGGHSNRKIYLLKYVDHQFKRVDEDNAF